MARPRRANADLPWERSVRLGGAIRDDDFSALLDSAQVFRKSVFQLGNLDGLHGYI